MTKFIEMKDLIKVEMVDPLSEPCKTCGVAKVAGQAGTPKCFIRCPREDKLDAYGQSDSDYKKAENECPNGYIVVWNWMKKGFKYFKLDKDGYVTDECYEPPAPSKVTWIFGETYEQFIKRMEIY